ncbi:THO complex subunit 4A-like isoform X1 [Diospyros lotus]|uniref:THO complex subunit 4A-like isoform X1 n=1 Tax=Diospyros lotus TaxID=55363 RepID=UPI0022507980|nr:THO complex subunit 4A-like isoform X1 [Diospyros lotus]
MSGSGALDMTLDDLIKSNRQSGRGGGGGFRGRGGASTGPGPARRIPIRGTNRTAPYPTAKAPESVWKHDLFTVDQAMAYSVQASGRTSSIETETKLYISNLDYGVSNEDIKELFSEVGDLKRYSIHYDRSGRSKGTAEVVFSRRQDALSAVKRYNNVQLDGKPMKIEIVGTHIAIPRLPPSANDSFGNVNGFPRSAQGRGGASGRGRGGRSGGRGFGRGRGRGRGRGEKISAEDLDSDLEKYHSEAMQTDN